MASGNPQVDTSQAQPRKATASGSGCSLAGCASCLTALLLAAAVSAVWGLFYFGRDNVHDAYHWSRMLLICVLVVAIPLVLYRLLRLWLEGEASRFPDVDYAWEAGVRELAHHGLSVDALPLFLILGSSGERLEKALMQATGFDFRVQAIPEADAPLHWYASPDAIYLFCTDASWLSAVAWLTDQKQRDGGRARAGNPPAGQELGGSPAAMGPRGSSSADPTAGSAAPGGQRGTILLDQFLPQQPQAVRPLAGGTPRAQPAPRAAVERQAASPSTDAGRGTILLDQFLQSPAASGVASPSPSPLTDQIAPGDSTSGRGAVVADGLGYGPQGQEGIPLEEILAVVSPAQAFERLQKLQYVCRLLRRARRPLCAINGILTLLPFRAVHASPAEAEELERATKSDLLAIQRGLRLRCPVTAMVTGLEEERGFSELVRRVGPERAASQRFGRKFDLRSVPAPEELAALCVHVCGAFEDWVYTLFREHQALSRPGNTKLYGLLCKVRCSLKPRLTEILSRGFGYDRRESPDDDPFLFSGCYFAATGDTPDRQAFVKGVVDKLVEEQEFVDWIPREVAANRRYTWFAYAGFLVGVALLASGAALILGRLR